MDAAPEPRKGLRGLCPVHQSGQCRMEAAASFGEHSPKRPTTTGKKPRYHGHRSSTFFINVQDVSEHVKCVSGDSILFPEEQLEPCSHKTIPNMSQASATWG